jgi:predicted phage terminase large subunit-like protein
MEAQQQENDIILFSVPPQHGKTTTFTIHKAAYRIIKNPMSRGIIISYNLDITSRFHREILAILEKENIPLYSKSQKEIVLSNLTGSISFCGFSGGLTSKPADWIIIDDPIRNINDACSENYQETLWNGFATAIISRLQKKFKLEITHTRWHENDLIGQIITKVEELGVDFKYKYINLPAICESEDDPLGRQIGEVLCPERFDLESIKMKMLLAQGDGYALYQGCPVPPDGALFNEELIVKHSFQNLSEVPHGSISFLSVDCAFKETKNSDFVAIGAYKYCIKSGNLYKIDQVNSRLDFSNTVLKVRELFKTHRCMFCLVEAKANGDAVINVLSKEFTGFIPIEPEGGKVARAYAAQPFIKTGHLKIYKSMVHYPQFINQLKSFPRGRNDDMVDETTQAINYIFKEYGLKDFSALSQGYQYLSGYKI